MMAMLTSGLLRSWTGNGASGYRIDERRVNGYKKLSFQDVFVQFKLNFV